MRFEDILTASHDDGSSHFARNDVQQLRQHGFRRIDKWSFTDPDSSHPLVETFRARLGIDHQGAGFHLSCASDSRPAKHSLDPACPVRGIEENGVEQRDTLKRGWRYCDDADELA